MLGEPEKILRHQGTLDKTQILIENRNPTSLEYVSVDNSRVLRLASIAQYRTKRRIAIAEKRLAKALLLADRSQFYV
jgi:hypothetical protein